MSHNGRYEEDAVVTDSEDSSSWNIEEDEGQSGSVRDILRTQDDQTYGSIFVEASGDLATICNNMQCITSCSCNNDNGWYANPEDAGGDDAVMAKSRRAYAMTAPGTGSDAETAVLNATAKAQTCYHAPENKFFATKIVLDIDYSEDWSPLRDRTAFYAPYVKSITVEDAKGTATTYNCQSDDCSPYLSGLSITGRWSETATNRLSHKWSGTPDKICFSDELIGSFKAEATGTKVFFAKEGDKWYLSYYKNTQNITYRVTETGPALQGDKIQRKFYDAYVFFTNTGGSRVITADSANTNNYPYGLYMGYASFATQNLDSVYSAMASGAGVSITAETYTVSPVGTMKSYYDDAQEHTIDVLVENSVNKKECSECPADSYTESTCGGRVDPHLKGILGCAPIPNTECYELTCKGRYTTNPEEEGCRFTCEGIAGGCGETVGFKDGICYVCAKSDGRSDCNHIELTCEFAKKSYGGMLNWCVTVTASLKDVSRLSDNVVLHGVSAEPTFSTGNPTERPHVDTLYFGSFTYPYNATSMRLGEEKCTPIIGPSASINGCKVSSDYCNGRDEYPY